MPIRHLLESSDVNTWNFIYKVSSSLRNANVGELMLLRHVCDIHCRSSLSSSSDWLYLTCCRISLFCARSCSSIWASDWRLSALQASSTKKKKGEKKAIMVMIFVLSVSGRGFGNDDMALAAIAEIFSIDLRCFSLKNKSIIKWI